jgi:hypothetical protein
MNFWKLLNNNREIYKFLKLLFEICTNKNLNIENV